ncbi:ABC transporter ATP-binding protein [Microbacterium sp. AGC62]|uniref:ABC transporter ATP-binding protein n=1 Tax=unclassified Microbacterium TaxID=2609290 RepID=UPI000492EF29|nr:MULTISPECIES: ABC transporter ATP-binding protein [unclassified Microbacterium]
MKAIFSTYRDIMPNLPDSARRYINTFVLLSALLAALDVAALMILAVSLSSMLAGTPVQLPVVGAIGPDGYIWIIVFVSGLIILKSTASLIMQWFATRRLASFELEIGDQLFQSYIHAPWIDRLQRNTTHLVRLADVGIANVTSGFLLPFMSLPALLTTSLLVVVVIVIMQPLTALVTVCYLGLIALLLYVVLSRRTVTAGRVNRDYSFRVAALMTDMVSALKEITLRNKSDEVARVVQADRSVSAKARANLNFLSSVPRFVLDAGIVGGFLLVGGAAMLFSGFEAAVSAIALFGVAGFRLVPSLTGFQSLVSMMTANIPHVEAVLRDIESSRRYRDNSEHIGHDPIVGTPTELNFHGVGFTFPNAPRPALADVTGSIPFGTRVGIVGASGAGKSTLVDLLLGLLTPTAGHIALGDQDLTDVMAAWRGRVGYVPQDVALFDATIAQNVALTWTDDFDETRVREALRKAQLLDVVEARADGIHGRVGDRGLQLSGGQRQRLGIARALYAEPLVLVLDEATSALDTRTEAAVTASIDALGAEITVISVAHRLSTIRHSDQVWFLREGEVRARGTFAEVIAQEPEFAHQAALAGLTKDPSDD